jgi:hypothetical protein
MKKVIAITALCICQGLYAEDIEDTTTELEENKPEENINFYFRNNDGITIYVDRIRPEYPLETIEGDILTKLNGPAGERQQFIKEDLLGNAGFSPNATVRYRKTNGTEKVLSILHGVTHALVPQVFPMKPFFKTEYDRMPEGTFFKFETVFFASEYSDISVEVRKVMELEYIYQIEFYNGILIEDYNLNYYTEENIAKFENMATLLPDTPQSVRKLKERYLYECLPKIKAALDRHRNPSENYLRAKQNLRGAFKIRNEK